MTFDRLKQWLTDPARRPLVMGVLNVTPDSFSDGGLFADAGAAIAHADEMCRQGADIIDIGGESSRPGAARIDPAEQIRRVSPVLKGLAGRVSAVLSIDTTRAMVAEAAIDCGATMINDISAGTDDSLMLALAARRSLPIILMHMAGQPANMQAAPAYEDVVVEVCEYLAGRAAAAERAGVSRHNILIDPGIGFGKTVEHNLQLLRAIDRLTSSGRPVVIGASRKSFIGKITGESDPARRVFGTAASVAWSVSQGAAIVRVHDVEPMAEVVKIIRAIQTGGCQN